MGAFTLHDLADCSWPIGVECNHCMHRAIFAPGDLQAQHGDHRTLADAGVHCGRCGSREFSVVRFPSRGKAHAFLRNL